MSHNITIKPEHLPVFQTQLLTIRHQLISTEILPNPFIGKTAWLSICAQAIGYLDWDDLTAQTKTPPLSTNSIVFDHFTS